MRSHALPRGTNVLQTHNPRHRVAHHPHHFIALGGFRDAVQRPFHPSTFVSPVSFHALRAPSWRHSTFYPIQHPTFDARERRRSSTCAPSYAATATERAKGGRPIIDGVHQRTFRRAPQPSTRVQSEVQDS
ncbi:hypothetical protein C8Q73DRAFT_14272 [Cubamyces lactineus]|nr:hypothetical protein C8Q73DRAFT_14272 [Cubamyces lactineus]